jgi:hypothetical protein
MTLRLRLLISKFGVLGISATTVAHVQVLAGCQVMGEFPIEIRTPTHE